MVSCRYICLQSTLLEALPDHWNRQVLSSSWIRSVPRKWLIWILYHSFITSPSTSYSQSLLSFVIWYCWHFRTIVASSTFHILSLYTTQSRFIYICCTCNMWARYKIPLHFIKIVDLPHLVIYRYSSTTAVDVSLHTYAQHSNIIKIFLWTRNKQVLTGETSFKKADMILFSLPLTNKP